MMLLRPHLLALLLAGLVLDIGAQSSDRQIAVQFAPVFHQALGDDVRSDYITNFDFDGDWRGDNNWNNLTNRAFPLRAYIYYSVVETRTHYLIHYAVFHPRDYKGGTDRGRIFSELLRQGSRIVGDNDPTGLLIEATSAHENDLEGVLIAALKTSGGLEKSQVQYVQTLSHNTFISYTADERPGKSSFVLEDGRPVFYIEPRGHGIEAFYPGNAGSPARLIYKYKAVAEDPDKRVGEVVGYDLLPIETTLWMKARAQPRVRNLTYGSVHSYPPVKLNIVNTKGRVATQTLSPGTLGSAFLGKEGGVNMARPPWGWFDMNRRGDPLGLWFFDPAGTLKRDFGLDDSFSTDYLKSPFWAQRS